MSTVVTIEKIVRDEADPIEAIEKRIADGQVVKSDLEAWLRARATELQKDGETLAQSYSRNFTGVRAADPIGQAVLHKMNSLAGLSPGQQREVAKAGLAR